MDSTLQEGAPEPPERGACLQTPVRRPSAARPPPFPRLPSARRPLPFRCPSLWRCRQMPGSPGQHAYAPAVEVSPGQAKFDAAMAAREESTARVLEERQRRREAGDRAAVEQVSTPKERV